MPLAQRVADGLRAYDAAESQLFSAPDVVASLPALSEAAGQLAEMPQQERYLVYHLAAGLRPTGQAGQASGAEGTEDEGLGSGMLRAVRRGSVNLGVGAAQALGQFSSSLVRHLGENLGDSLGSGMAGGGGGRGRPRGRRGGPGWRPAGSVGGAWRWRLLPRLPVFL